jgi:hypothetical protein
MPEPIHPDNRAQLVTLVVQLHTETVCRVDVTDVSGDNPNDRLVSMAIGDDRSGVRLLGQLRDVHSWSSRQTGSSPGSGTSAASRIHSAVGPRSSGRSLALIADTGLSGLTSHRLRHAATHLMQASP